MWGDENDRVYSDDQLNKVYKHQSKNTKQKCNGCKARDMCFACDKSMQT